VTRWSIAAIVFMMGVAAAAADDKPTTRHALAMARAYLARWQELLEYLVADETFEQEVRSYRRTSAGIDQPLGRRTRTLRSEVLLVRAPAQDVWLSFRDVFEVDGTRVADRDRRMEDLFHSPLAAVLSTGSRLAEEGARFNLGRLGRTINIPTAAFAYLHSRYESNTTWKLDADERLNGMRTWELAFDQRRPPFVVTLPDERSLPSAGRFWIEPGTGRIHQWELVVRGRGATFRVVTEFGAVSSVPDGWVPLRLRESYDGRGLEQLKGAATYSNHRVFRTSGRIIKPPQP
jgi:hypothetical protein